ncbi:MAG TPA: class I adenylate-forming enzyme family protein [Actinocrinis sp.]|nr:class I adenylate-forming enzyme family protein [Actinocrinis sp.]
MSRSIRAVLAADPDVGAGNVMTRLVELGEPLDGPGLAFDTDVDGHPAWGVLTLGELYRTVAARAALLRDSGVRRRDPVAILVSTSADCLLSFMALTWLGAIPALINPALPRDVAAEYIRRLRATGLIADAAHRELLDGETLGLERRLGLERDLVLEAERMGEGDPDAAPSPYRLHQDDPIAITHSSGTTRMPTAVVHTHGSLFAGTRLIRLATPRARGTERVMSALPAPHAAGIASINHVMCNRGELLYLSRQDDGAAILDAIERWKPTGIFGFAVTWAELARFDLTQRAVDSVAMWFNTGDCAHEPHVRRLVAAGSHEKFTREGIRRVPGSMFIDGLGSTEMGHSAFHITHRSDTDHYGRCVGRPHVFAEIALIDVETGEEVPPGTVGHFALKAPSVAAGYWNDSTSWYRTRWNGYYLTGDLLYRDEEGYYYHVDRAVDAVDLGGGDWLYTAMSEERILKQCPDVRDCTVLARRDGGERVVTDVLLALHTGADPHADRSAPIRAALGDAAAATLREISVVEDGDLITGPTGKVRKFLMRQRALADSAAG